MTHRGALRGVSACLTISGLMVMLLAVASLALAAPAAWADDDDRGRGDDRERDDDDGRDDDDDGDDGRTLLVDDDRVQCPRAEFTMIEPAVEAAQPGDRVLVCPGDYTEQVSFESDDSRITLESQRYRKATIHYPGDLAVPATQRTVVLVDGARGVEIEKFVITGPYQVGCVPGTEVHSGVRVVGNGSASIVGNHVTKIRNVAADLLGCQDGLAILVGRTSTGQVGRAHIAHNLIDEYQKNGITVDNEDSYAKVVDNHVDGLGETPIIANNGVQVSRFARAQVEDNLITDNRYIVPGDPNDQAFYSSGIILFGVDGGVDVEDNRLRNNGDGVSVSGDSFGSGGAPITRKVDVEENSIRGGQGSGIYFDETTENNRIEENSSFENAVFDCEDNSTGSRTAGTANVWDDNRGLTDNRGGRLCKSDDDDDDDDDGDGDFGADASHTAVVPELGLALP